MIRHLGPGWRLGLLYAALFAAVGVSLPFLPLWLQASGMSAAEIGVIIGVPVLVRVVAAPLVAEVADRTGRPVRTLRLSVLATLAAYVLLGLAEGFWVLLAAAALVAAASAAVIPLCDSLAVRTFRTRQGRFGTVRLWGSVSFVASSAVAGVMVDAFSPARLIWLLVAFQVFALAAAVACVADEKRSGEVSEKAPSSRLLLVPGLVLAAIAAAMIQASHAAYYSLGSVHWRALGLDGPTIALLWSIGVVAEIALFFGSSWVWRGVGPGPLLLAGAAAAMLRWSAMALDPGLAVLLPLQMLHAFSFAATYLGMMRAAALAPSGLEARVQGFSATLHGLAMAAAMAWSGSAYDGTGAAMYGSMVVLAGFGGAITLAAWRWLRSAP